jgi:hypothetical protein
MRRVWFDPNGRWWLCYLLTVLSLSGCGAAYHFRYHYTLVSPPGAIEGLEDDQLRIQLSPDPAGGIMEITVTNKSVQPLVIVWEQTHYMDPLGRRRQATETGMRWFFRFTDDTHIAPGEVLRTRVQPGGPQTYNPFTVSRTASGEVALSSTPATLFPTAGDQAAVGKNYQGQEFRFVLSLRRGTEAMQYPFTFRITEVEVQ